MERDRGGEKERKRVVVITQKNGILTNHAKMNFFFISAKSATQTQSQTV